MELQLNKSITFDTGFIVQSQTQLISGTSVWLYIDSVLKQYSVSKSGNTIMDSWTNISYIPLYNSNVCFSLYDTSPICPPITCTLFVL